MLGFVEGTANSVGPAVPDSTFITAEDDRAAERGSYVVVQRYLHDSNAWCGLKMDRQEAVIGRTRCDCVEVDDADDDVQKAQKQLVTVEDGREEFDIPGSPGKGSLGLISLSIRGC